MWRQIQRTSEPLNERHRAALSPRNAVFPRSPLQRAEHGDGSRKNVVFAPQGFSELRDSNRRRRRWGNCGKRSLLSKQLVEIIKKKLPKATLSISTAAAVSTTLFARRFFTCQGRQQRRRRYENSPCLASTVGAIVVCRRLWSQDFWRRAAPGRLDVIFKQPQRLKKGNAPGRNLGRGPVSSTLCSGVINDHRSEEKPSTSFYL